MPRSRSRTYSEAMSLIRSGKIASLYVVWGDAYLYGRLIVALRRQLLPEGGDDFDLVSYDAGGLSPAEMLAAVRTVPFVAVRRMVVVDRVRAFRPAARGSGGGAVSAVSDEGPAAETEGPEEGRVVQDQRPDSGQSRTASGTASDWERLVGGVPAAACLVLVLDGPPDARLRLTKLASETGELVDCDTSGREGATIAGQALRERAVELGIKIGWREMSLLLTTVGSDCGRLVSELEKIAIYCSGKAPTEGDVLLLCARTAESDIWQLLDAVDTGRADEALRIVRAALGRGESPVALVASLASQLRMMARALERIDSGVSPRTLAAALGANRYWVEQSLRRARGFSVGALYDAMCALARLDLAIKTGTLDGAAGVENFVLALASARAAQGSEKTAAPAPARAARDPGNYQQLN